MPELVRWLPWARPGYSRQDTRRYLRSARLARLQRQALEFVLEENATAELLGMASLHRIDWTRRCAGVGYWVRASRWGQGIAAVAVEALVDFAFRELALHRLELHIATDNHASHRVAQKLGFQREGVARDAEFIDGEFRDHAQYSLLRTEVPLAGEAR